jgi:hypothetical protein
MCSVTFIQEWSSEIQIGEGVHELLQVIRREADVIMQHMVMCWPSCPLKITQARLLNRVQTEKKETIGTIHCTKWYGEVYMIDRMKHCQRKLYATRIRN